MSSLVAETDQLHAVLESTAASSLVAETDRLHVVSESTAAPSFAAETDQLPRGVGEQWCSWSVGILVVTLLGLAELVGCA